MKRWVRMKNLPVCVRVNGTGAAILCAGTWIWQNLVLNASDSELFLPGFGGSSPSAFETEAFLLPVSLASGEHALRARDYH
ncbi:hypothetical protein DAEQUDRAFT_770543 [Daedalea quercina L-15889]|uniref:Uncharacterized protein n=1 Tax=Daedalea quercina L-15889 TaxID=1314783 RepID=A0A165KS18_9APHY|nr:hypothetical protein DAEQUDRAFT_770543 [Daedalea quercina L-15889]